MADGNITVEVSTQAAQTELERLRAENAALKHDLQYARDGLTKGRTRMREDNERLREVVGRMVAGIDHLDKLAREWEPDHSSGADRRGWLLAKDARDDAVRALGPNVAGNRLARQGQSELTGVLGVFGRSERTNEC
jgi:hypothetical protein